ncbi:DUF2894 domain-containing protein [soil metagenome]
MSEVDTDHGTTIAAMRARGDHRHDPVRFIFIEAMVRRALVQQGAARRILDERLTRLLATYAEEIECGYSADNDTKSAPHPTSTVAMSGPITTLIGQLARRASTAQDSPAAVALRYFRSTWSKLSAERHLSQSLATVPENPGPLNSHHLVHQALKSMRDLSPGYLSHFMAHVDALFWLDGANATGAAAAASASREAPPKKATRSKPIESGGASGPTRPSKGAGGSSQN